MVQYSSVITVHATPIACLNSSSVFGWRSEACLATNAHALRANVPDYITREQWPPRSPDLNPIENQSCVNFAVCCLVNRSSVRHGTNLALLAAQ